MKVILLQDVKDLGKKFDVKNVKDGYGHNFLLPRNLAKIATAKSIKELETQKIIWQKEEDEIKNKLETLSKEFQEKEFHFTLKTGEKGEVFGSISKADIKKLITPSLFNNDVEINLEKPIKTLGAHQVEINLGRGVKTLIKLVIEPLQS